MLYADKWKSRKGYRVSSRHPFTRAWISGKVEKWKRVPANGSFPRAPFPRQEAQPCLRNPQCQPQECYKKSRGQFARCWGTRFRCGPGIGEFTTAVTLRTRCRAESENRGLLFRSRHIHNNRPPRSGWAFFSPQASKLDWIVSQATTTEVVMNVRQARLQHSAQLTPEIPLAECETRFALVVCVESIEFRCVRQPVPRQTADRGTGLVVVEQQNFVGVHLFNRSRLPIDFHGHHLGKMVIFFPATAFLLTAPTQSLLQKTHLGDGQLPVANLPT